MKPAICLMVLCAILAGRATAAAPVPAFDHVVVIVFENKETTSVLGNGAAPTFNSYARRFAKLTRYYGVTHPSLPNYLALVSGSTQGITTSCTDCVVDATSLADTIEASGRTWKTYAEGLPAPGFLGAFKGRYAKKHNPFAYFRDIADDPARRARLVPLTRLAPDLRAGALPSFSLIVPDLCHSMHDCPVSAGDAWLRSQVGRFLKLPKTVVFVVFDEGSTSTRGGGHTAALAFGTTVRPGSRYTGLTSHYGILRTVEEAWGLPLLGHSAHVGVITGIWR
ncbi:MAG TPA: alkaline phosphatase family protein [Gaiellaceae bacterium]